MIVDDIWVEIGSMNCNRRSMTHDLEAAIAIVDGDMDHVPYGSYGKACRFARDLRLSLWSEHLLLSTSDTKIQEPISGFDEWKRLADERTVTAHNHVSGQNRRDWSFLNLWDGVIDPQGRCPGAPNIASP